MKIRSFLAIDINKDVKQELANLIALLEPKAKGVKWIKPDLMHCTVRFFGDVEEELLLGDFSSSLEKIVAEYNSFELKGVGIGVFPNWRYPRVIWAGLVGDIEEAIKLHEGIDVLTKTYELKKDERLFRLHLTLGRAKSPIKNPENFVGFVEKLAGKKYGKILVDKLTLYKSVLTKDGPIYTPLRVFNLKNKQKNKSDKED